MDLLRDSLVQFFINAFLTILGLFIAVYGIYKASKQPVPPTETRTFSSIGTPAYQGYPLPATRRSSSAPCLIVAGTVICLISISCFLVAGPVYNFAANVIYSVTHNFTSGGIPGFGNTPDDTLNTFCNDIQSGDSEGAYNQFSSKLKLEEHYAQFQQSWSNKNVLGGCGHDPVTLTGNNATTTLTTADYFTKVQTSYHVTLIKDSNGIWKIDTFQQV